MASITIQICLNANRSVNKTCKIKPDSTDKFYKKLVKLSKDKLRIKKKPHKFFLNQTGEEITKSNIKQLISLQYAKNFKTTLSISVSLGEEYVGIRKEMGATQKHICLMRCIVSSATISSDAEKQLEACQRLKGMKLVVAQPDIHPGKGYPIGVSLVSQQYVYPYLIGTDIGCGMALIETNICKDIVNDQRLHRWLHDIKLDEPWIHDQQILRNKLIDWPSNAKEDGIDIDAVIQNGVNIHAFDHALGTIGHGNHFAELQCIEQIVDGDLFAELGWDANKLFLTVHSGSRGFGAAILDNYLKAHKAQKPLDVGSDDFQSYMLLHDNALKWARKNRMIIAQRFLRCMGAGTAFAFDNCICHIDVYHNYLCGKAKHEFVSVEREILREMDSGNTERKMERDVVNICEKSNDGQLYSQCIGILDELVSIFEENKEEFWYIHRKGAAPSDCGYVVIAGSRGAYSYIVKPNEEQRNYGYSLAHGAGRKLTRSQAVKKMSKKCPNVNQLKKTELQSHVICGDKSLMYEEAPLAYKDIAKVIQDLVDHNLITVVAILKPIITYKNRKDSKSSKSSKYSKHKHSRNVLLSND